MTKDQQLQSNNFQFSIKEQDQSEKADFKCFFNWSPIFHPPSYEKFFRTLRETDLRVKEGVPTLQKNTEEQNRFLARVTLMNCI